MPTVMNLYTLIARDFNTDPNDKMNSIIKVIDKFTFDYNPKNMKDQGVTLGKNPVVFDTKFTVATSWYLGEPLKKDTHFVFKVNIIGPGSQDLGGTTQESMVPAGFERMNMNFNTTGLPVLKAGKYSLNAQVLSKNGKILASGEYPFNVELKEE